MTLLRRAIITLSITGFLASPCHGHSIGYVCHAERSGDSYGFTAHYPPQVPGAGTGEKLPIPSLEIYQPGRFLWTVEADSGTQMVDTLTYGIVPPGYSQQVPEMGKPVSLQVGDVYQMTCGAGSGAFLVTPTGVENLGKDDPRAMVGVCSCPPEDSLMAAVEHATAVFVGRVERDEVLAPASQATIYRTVTFSVSRWIKGTGPNRVAVLTGPQGGSRDCVLYFAEGRSYLVYAHPIAGRAELVTDRCTRTKPFNAYGQREAAQIREPQKQ